MKAIVIVKPKTTVLDPQGVAIRDAVRHHPGLEHAVAGVRAGKRLEIDLEASAAADPALEEKLHAVCRDLLSNPVIEDYELHLER
ncbi:MAG: phosphoribosylformylglycinamidine synthase subunit PurS [Verrucomicrobia bacterium]|nr:phosphoribosylformylglycinamidine synthase subunit PurS [Verrucomicrobiota bacterium]MBV9658802.1 phosphoribosylformylglycinamidine synthase subunit PurS [Verrucomicrobiota bacterium]